MVPARRRADRYAAANRAVNSLRALAVLACLAPVLGVRAVGPAGAAVVARLVDERPPDPAYGAERVPYASVGGEERIALSPCATPDSGVPPSGLARCEVVSAPFTIPPDALFATAVALDEGTRAGATAPIELRTSLLDGAREETIARTILDPRRDADRRWIEQRADLAPFGGHTVRLRLSAKAAGGGGALARPLWADPRVVTRDERALGVVIVSLDTLRAMSVGAYGSSRPTTPILDARIGGAGVVFDHAIAPWPHTRPSHMSLFTGLYPRTHAVLPDVGPGLGAGIRTLPEILRAAGYETAAFTEDGYLDPRAGFRRGFATHEELKSADLHEPSGFASTTFHEGLAWLADHHHGPFFLFLHTYEVHYPYTPPPPYDEAFESIDAEGRDADRDLLRYEQEARSLDDQFGVFLDRLDALGLAARTLVVVLADHGEEFLEHGMVRHGFQLYEETLHVPLMMRLPGVTPPGLRVAAPTSLIDVAPTILDVLGLPPEPGLEGGSLLPLVLGRPAALDRPGVFFQAGITFGLRTAECHCIIGLRGRSGATCFDVVADPDQWVPLPDAHPCRARAALECEAFRRLSRLPLLDAGRPPPGMEGVDEERQRKLRALGYL